MRGSSGVCNPTAELVRVVDRGDSPLHEVDLAVGPLEVLADHLGAVAVPGHRRLDAGHELDVVLGDALGDDQPGVLHLQAHDAGVAGDALPTTTTGVVGSACGHKTDHMVPATEGVAQGAGEV
jgi:hypothetical protein